MFLDERGETPTPSPLPCVSPEGTKNEDGKPGLFRFPGYQSRFVILWKIYPKGIHQSKKFANSLQDKLHFPPGGISYS